MVRERQTAEDLAQDAFSSAFSSLVSFRREASPRTWLLAITRNRCIDHLRRLSRDPWGGAAADESEPDLQPDEAPLPADIVLRRADVEAAMSSLAEGERALIVLRFRHGLEYPELANVFGVREGTLRMRLSRALAKMRDELETLDLGARARAMPAEMPQAAYSAPPPVPPAAAADRLPSPPAAAGRHPAPPPGMAPPPPARQSPPPPRAAAPPPAPAFGSSFAAPRARAGRGWWMRLLAWLGVREAPATAPDDDEEPSEELRERLAELTRGLPSR
jgi:RNA polymerase sigma factor (sigma-70 family)